MTDNDIKTIEMMSVLTEPTRIKILQLISSEGELCAKNILPMFQITQPTLSHHLNLLVENDILVARKDGRFTYYSVNKKSIDSIRKLIDSLTEPPVVRTIKRPVATPVVAKPKATPVLKRESSVPAPKIAIASPDLEEIKKTKKKKKSEKKKKDKEKDKKKKK